MQILNERQIKQKTRRLATEILEHHYKESEIILAGINNNGLHFAQLLMEELLDNTDIPITLTRISLNPANPLEREVILEMPPALLEGKNIIIVDDVANTGRTIFYAFQPILATLPKRVEVAVLVDRMHKAFPIKVDYVGLTLATTLLNNIKVSIRNVAQLEVNLE